MSLAAFSLLMWLAQFSPGPDMLLLMQTAVSRGRRAALATVAGIATGLTVHCAVILSGAALLLKQHPAALHGLQLAGGLYLLWIGWPLWRWVSAPEAARHEAPPIESPASIAPPAGFRRGLITNLLNAKALLFLLSSLVAAMGKENIPVMGLPRGGVLTAIVVGQALIGWSAFVCLLTTGHVQRWFKRHETHWMRLFGLLLVGLGLWASWVAGRSLIQGGNETGSETPPAHVHATEKDASVVSPPSSTPQAWPAWRGPHHTGVATADARPPLHWSEKENVRWKIALQSVGHGSPVIANDLIVLCGARPVGEAQAPVYDQAPGTHDNLPVTHTHEFVVVAYALETGHRVWERVVTTTFPPEGGHATGSLASHSSVTDGTRVWAFFGSRGLYCLELKTGSILWKKDLGRMTVHHAHGEGASPALHRDVLIVPWDQEQGSFVSALQATTGKELWKAERPKEITSWSTPLIVPTPANASPHQSSGSQVILSATDRIRSYDLLSGTPLWECSGMSRNVIATPVAGDGMVFCGCSYDKRAMIAIRLAGAHGDITTSDHVVWSTNQRTPYVPSPLLHEGRLYFLGHYQGLLSCLDARTGERLTGPVRLDSLQDIYASPVLANGRLYITDRSGLTAVIDPQDLSVLAQNQLDDRFSASAAVVGPDLILRGEKHLYCLRAAGSQQE